MANSLDFHSAIINEFHRFSLVLLSVKQKTSILLQRLGEDGELVLKNKN